MKNLVAILITTGSLLGCNNQSGIEEAPQSDLLIQLSDEQIAFNGILTGRMKKEPLHHVVKATGRVDVPPDYSLSLSAPIGAYIVKVFVLPGSRIQQGAVLAQLRHPAIAEIQQAYLSTSGELDFLQKDASRKKDLLEGNTVSAREYEKLNSDLINVEAKLRTTIAELNRLGLDPASIRSDNITQYLNMTAPVSGVVTEVFQKKGEFVDANMPLVSLLNRDHEHVELEVFQGDLMKIRKGMPVNLRLPGSDGIFTGEVFLVNSQLNEETLSGNVHVHPGDNFPNVPVNAAVFGEVIYQVDTAYTIRRSEVIREGTSYFIFTRSPQGFVKEEVFVGFDDGQQVEITGPENIFDKVVVMKGNYYLNGI